MSGSAVLFHKGHADIVAAALDALQAVMRSPGREAALARAPAIFTGAILIFLHARVPKGREAARSLDMSEGKQGKKLPPVNPGKRKKNTVEARLPAPIVIDDGGERRSRPIV